MSALIRYLVFDIESIADAPLVAKLRYPGQSLAPAEGVRRYRAELLEKFESDFIPYTFQLPISVAVGKVAADFRLVDIVVLDEPQFRPHVIAENFWRGWEKYHRPTLVSFNGRGFDVPLLELTAFRYGLSLPGWFQSTGKPSEQSRNRYNTAAHIDLCELLTNFGSTRFHGGLNLAANLIGKPGKMDVQGNMVQDLYDRGQAGRDQRLLPLRRAGHLLRLPSHPRAHRAALDRRRAGDRRRSEDLAPGEGRAIARLSALPGMLGRLAEPVETERVKLGPTF